MLVNWSTQKHIVFTLTAVFFSATLIICFVWFFANNSDIEPLAVASALVTAGLGSYYQFHVSPMIERNARVRAVVHELYKNMSLFRRVYFGDRTGIPKMRYPQYNLAATRLCLAPGILDSGEDFDLFDTLHVFYDAMRTMNSMLAVEQMNSISRISSGGPIDESGMPQHERIVNSVFMKEIQREMYTLYDVLRKEKYAKMHGIAEDAALFPEIEGSYLREEAYNRAILASFEWQFREYLRGRLSLEDLEIGSWKVAFRQTGTSRMMHETWEEWKHQGSAEFIQFMEDNVVVDQEN